MTIVICLFFGMLVAAILIPTLPESRRVRLILGIFAIPLVVGAFGVLEKFSSRPGAESINAFVKKSDQLLKEGKTEVILAAFRDYHAQGSSTFSDSLAAAERARFLYSALRHQELMHELQSKNGEAR